MQLACVLGGMDIVRPLALAGIRSLVVTPPGKPQAYSRSTYATIDATGIWDRPELIVERMLARARHQSQDLALFFDQDGYTLFVSRYREQLGARFRFAMPSAMLVEDLVDKERFQRLAERLALPVPRALVIRPTQSSSPEDLALRFPIIVKPLTRLDRDSSWRDVSTTAKAIRIEDGTALATTWPRLAAAGADCLAQELIPGPEDRMESYHAYIDEQGVVVADFTGREVRTFPAEFGHSTAVVTTQAGDTTDFGRQLVRRIGLTGVVKIDFKRGLNGELHLLEVNPRFSFWCHPGALAGVNLPAIVFADLTGSRRPEGSSARAGVTWCDPVPDWEAAQAAHLTWPGWIQWLLACDAFAAFSWDDPMPLIRGILWPSRRAIANRMIQLAGRLSRRTVRSRTGRQ